MQDNSISKNVQGRQNTKRIQRIENKTINTKTEKRNAIYAAFLFLTLMSALCVLFMGDSVLLDNLSISVFIISCILLIKLSGPIQQQ